MLQQDLLNVLQQDARLASLFDYRNNRAPFAIGLPPALWAGAAASLFQQSGRSFCILTPDTEKAAKAVQNLKAMLPEAAGRIFMLPPLEISPLTDFQPEAEVTAARLQALTALVKAEPCLIVTPAEALLGKFQRKEAFCQ